MIIIQNCEAKVVIHEIDSYEQMQEPLALLQVLMLGNREVEAGQARPASDVIAELRERLRADRCPLASGSPTARRVI